MRFYWKPSDRMVPFVGVCWWNGQVIASLWPAVWYLGKERQGLNLWELRRRFEREGQ